MIKITKNQLTYLLNGASKDDMRHNLQSIHFDVKAHLAVSTNGHLALTCQIEVENEAENVTYTADSIKFLLVAIKQAGKQFDSYLWEIENGQVNVLGQVIKLIKLNGQFPDYTTVLPKIEERQRQICLNRDVLEVILKASKDLNKDDRSITFCFSEEEDWNKKPAIVYIGENQSVIMPMTHQVNIGKKEKAD